MAPRSINISDIDIDIDGERVGGKAEGLKKLIELGLNVPKAFVITDIGDEIFPTDVDARYLSIGGGKVAVRSSAIGEDSADASFAGQYETVLNVEGPEALRHAIAECVRSIQNDRSDAYRKDQTDQTDVAMSVVVQQMVDARTAGVLFTVDPVSGRRDRMVIDSVNGLGDALVSGHATPDHYMLSDKGEVVVREIEGALPNLNETEIRTLFLQAKDAEARLGHPLDMEWAIDRDGTLCWLQARPVTNLPADLNGLDVPIGKDDVFTWCNIGEMMPGAVTPLTYSITGYGVDIGMQRMYRKIGVDTPDDGKPRHVGMFYGHLFINLREASELGSYVAGSTKEQLCLAICGRDIEELKQPELKSRIVRLVNGLRYGRLLLSAKKYGDKLQTLRDGLVLEVGRNSAATYKMISDNMIAIFDAYEYHLISSSSAGAISPIMLGIMAKGEPPTEAHHAQLAAILSGATDVESADIAAGTDRILDKLEKIPGALDAFANVDRTEATRWLRSAESREAGEEFADYLERHGHRAVRELDLRQKEWAADPSPLIASLQSGLRARLSHTTRHKVTEGEDPKIENKVLKRMIPFAHSSVRARERTKSSLVAVTTTFKRAYRSLAVQMVNEGWLPDDDAIFFLSHSEIGELLSGNTRLKEVIEPRRRALQFQKDLRFEEVFQGKPEPVVEQVPQDQDGALLGKPVSRGVVTAKARVVRTLEEAAALQAGEILIAPITDVGWTPYFGMISGLATDVGSAVSHGAVVAREYGLPAVVNLRAATSMFKTGDLVTLDGNSGSLILVERPFAG